jgi:hypothetical protein
MSMLERDLADLLDRHVPSCRSEGDWPDVLRRAEVERPAEARHKHVLRPVAVLVAATLLGLVASPAGRGWIGCAIDALSAWTGGQPGRPAPSDARAEFSEASRGSLAAFPPGADLRLLIRRDVQGVRYELYGFRDRDSVCLRLAAWGLPGRQRATACASLADVVRRGHVVTPLRTDVPLVRASGSVTAHATFGLALDGVDQVEVRTSDGRSEPVEVRENAFLSVDTHPGASVASLTALTTDGRRVPVEFVPALGTSQVAPEAQGLRAPGPTGVELDVHGGSIGWLERREARGQPLGDLDAVTSHGQVEFGRVLQPDPSTPLRIALALVRITTGTPAGAPQVGDEALCYLELYVGGSAGGTCVHPSTLFTRGPLFNSGPTYFGGSQLVLDAGLVSDRVSRLALFTARGPTVDIAIADNAFALQTRIADLPGRLVAYDDRDRVIGLADLPRP